MAIQLNATKGGFSITNGYLIITMTQMQRYLRPITISEQVTQDDGQIITVERPGVEPAVMYTARGQVYESASAREQSFGATELNFAFQFDHVAGQDSTEEAYQYVKTNGLDGWLLTGMTDV